MRKNPLPLEPTDTDESPLAGGMCVLLALAGALIALLLLVASLLAGYREPRL